MRPGNASEVCFDSRADTAAKPPVRPRQVFRNVVRAAATSLSNR